MSPPKKEKGEENTQQQQQHVIGFGYNFFYPFTSLTQAVEPQQIPSRQQPIEQHQIQERTTCLKVDNKENEMETNEDFGSAKHSAFYVEGVAFPVFPSLVQNIRETFPLRIQDPMSRHIEGKEVELSSYAQHSNVLPYGTRDIRLIVCGATHTAVLSKSGDIFSLGTLFGKVHTVPTSVPTRYVIALCCYQCSFIFWVSGLWKSLLIAVTRTTILNNTILSLFLSCFALTPHFLVTDCQ